MVLKLHGGSFPAGGGAIIVMVLAEKEIPFELVVVDMPAKADKTPDFLAMHRNEGFILYESRAICRYLADVYSDPGTPLVPAEPRARALVEQAASVEFANFHPAVAKIAMSSLSGAPVDHNIVVDGVAELSAKLDVYEVILGKHRFLSGDEISLADIFHLYFAPLLTGTEADIMTEASRPNVARWWNEIVSRPTWVKTKADGIQSVAL
ncbi:glutathione S-transferase [Mycena vitilis]|nr:glutathione S-transferase [Mycena vitilis]